MENWGQFFFSITNSQIVRSRSLTQRINYSGAPYTYRKEKETHKLFFSWLSSLGYCSWTRTNDDDDHGVAQGASHTTDKRLTDMQPWFISSFFDIRHPCYGQLTPVKTEYSLTNITWPYHRFTFWAQRGNLFFWSWPLTKSWFSFGSRAHLS